MYRLLGLLAAWTLWASPLPAVQRLDPGDFQGRQAADWVRELQSGDVHRRTAAAFALGKCGAAADPHLDVLLAALGDQAAPVRAAAAAALGENGFGSPDIIDGLSRRVTDDDDPEVRRAAARALGQLGEKAVDALPVLRRALADRHPPVRQNAAWAIGRMREKAKAASADLVALLSDRDPMVRRDAALAVGQIEAPAREAVEPLMQLLADAEDPVRYNAVDALAMIGPDAKAAMGKLVALVKNQPPHDDQELRQKALIAASAIGGPELREIMTDLRRTLRDRDRDADPLRQAVAQAFLNLGRQAMPALRELQLAVESDPVLDIRRYAALTLTILSDELRQQRAQECKEVTVWMLRIIDKTEEDPEVRLFLVQALINPPIPSLRSLDPDRDGVDPLKVLKRAALGGGGGAERILRYEAARVAVKEFGANARAVTPTLIDMVQDDSLTIRRSVAATTTTTGGETGVVGGKLNIESSGDGRALAAEALGMLGRAGGNEGPEAERLSAAARAALEMAAKDPKSKELRDAAAAALRRF